MTSIPAVLLQTIAQTIPQGVDYVRILPELILSAFGIVVMLLDPLVDEEKSQKTLGLIALVGTVAGLLATWYMAQSPGLAFSNMVKVDSFSVFFHFLVIAIAGSRHPEFVRIHGGAADSRRRILRAHSVWRGRAWR